VLLFVACGVDSAIVAGRYAHSYLAKGVACYGGCQSPHTGPGELHAPSSTLSLHAVLKPFYLVLHTLQDPEKDGPSGDFTHVMEWADGTLFRKVRHPLSDCGWKSNCRRNYLKAVCGVIR